MQVPDGWKLVPVEPTREMKEAGSSVGCGWYFAHAAYDRMIAAAPTPPAEAAVPRTPVDTRPATGGDDKAMREAFEAWFCDGGKSAHVIARASDGGYALRLPQSAWAVWQAAWAACPAAQADAEDAARYRWLRDNSDSKPGYANVHTKPRRTHFLMLPALEGSQLDEVIDAARQEPKT